MNGRRSMVGVALKLSAFAAVMVLLLVVVVAAINRPVDGRTDSYRAVFTDASGLKVGDDVRMFGVQVGEVTSIELENNSARVDFTVQRERRVTTAATLAIRYQTLTGQRYVDLRQPDGQAARQDPEHAIPPERTVASFDITTVFNGLRPVLTEFSPEALNRFTESMLAVVEGQGSGIGSALSAIEELSKHVTDRQQVFSILFHNLRQLSDSIGGRSADLITLLKGLRAVFAELENKMAGMLLFADLAPEVFIPMNNIMRIAGLTYPTNPNMQQVLRRLFPDPQRGLDQLAKLPGLLQALNSMIPEPAPVSGHLVLTCSKGQANLPEVIKVVISGQRISICQR